MCYSPWGHRVRPDLVTEEEHGVLIAGQLGVQLLTPSLWDPGCLEKPHVEHSRCQWEREETERWTPALASSWKPRMALPLTRHGREQLTWMHPTSTAEEEQPHDVFRKIRHTSRSEVSQWSWGKIKEGKKSKVKEKVSGQVVSTW